MDRVNGKKVESIHVNDTLKNEIENMFEEFNANNKDLTPDEAFISFFYTLERQLTPLYSKDIVMSYDLYLKNSMNYLRSSFSFIYNTLRRQNHYCPTLISEKLEILSNFIKNAKEKMEHDKKNKSIRGTDVYDEFTMEE